MRINLNDYTPTLLWNNRRIESIANRTSSEYYIVIFIPCVFYDKLSKNKKANATIALNELPKEIYDDLRKRAQKALFHKMLSDIEKLVGPNNFDFKLVTIFNNSLISIIHSTLNEIGVHISIPKTYYTGIFATYINSLLK